MVETTRTLPLSPAGSIDCACVIHGDAYDWTYVERLYNMLSRNLTPQVKFHVYTEASRLVPSHMTKHVLDDWLIEGPRKSWWYKMQLFNTVHHAGPLLYFDLDTVIVNNIDWICNLPLRYFWTVHDFKRLWRPTHQGINSSIMWWDTRDWQHVWRSFCAEKLDVLIKRYPGDQDYLTQIIDQKQRRFFDTARVKSWRWQCFKGGYDFKNRTYRNPDSGTVLDSQDSVLIFHGKPKPAEVLDSAILCHWK